MLRTMSALWLALLGITAVQAMFQTAHWPPRYLLPKSATVIDANMTIGEVSKDSIDMYYDVDEGKTLQWSFVLYEFNEDSGLQECPPSVSENSDRKIYNCRIDHLNSCMEYKLKYYGIPDTNPITEYYFSEEEGVQTTADETIAPANLTCNATVAGTLTLEWSNPFADDCQANFDVLFDGKALWDDELTDADNVTTGDTFYTRSEAIPEAEYNFDVTVRFPGDYFGATASTQCTTPAALSSPPLNVSVTPSIYDVTVSWEYPEQLNGIITRFDATVKWTNGSVAATKSTVGPATEVVVPGLASCSYYEVTVAAVNGAGTGNDSEPEETATLQDDDVNPTISITCSNKTGVVSVEWSEVLTNCEASSYSLKYSANVAWNETKNIPEKEATLEGEGLEFQVPQEDYVPGAEYSFVVSTDTRNGSCTVTSNDEQSTAPTLTVEDAGITYLYLSWETPASANGVILNYELEWMDSEGNSFYETIDVRNDFNLTQNVFACSSYQLSLVAVNGAGQGATDTEPAETLQADLSGIYCEVESDISVIVSWTAAPANCNRNGTILSWQGESLWDDYNIEGSESVEDGAYLLTDLYPYTSYNICVALTEDWAQESCCSPTTEQGVPTPPEIIQASSTQSSVSVTWETQERWNGIPSNYLVMCLSADQTVEVDLNHTELTIDELNEGTHYLISVEACNRKYCSNSSEKDVTTGEGSTQDSNTGVIVGATLGSIAFVVIIAAAVFFFVRTRRRNQLVDDIAERRRVLAGNDMEPSDSHLGVNPTRPTAVRSSSSSSGYTVSKF